MDNTPLIVVEVVSAIVCFVLVWFMVKPYRTTGESRYLGLPLGFAFLGVSYVLMGAAYFESFRFVQETKWLQLFTQTYAFTFLVATYFFSKKPTKHSRLWLDLTYAALILVAIVSYLAVAEPLIFGLPSYKRANEYLLLFNIICLAYISIHTLRSHASKLDPKTIWTPLSYILLSFGQYSLFIWSVDSSFAAYVGAQFLRLSGLLILLFVTYQAFHALHETPQKEGIHNEKASA